MNPFDELRNRPPMQWLRERDLDLLICSELHIPDSPLRACFFEGWDVSQARFEGAWVSHSESADEHYEAAGETDFIVAMCSEGRVLLRLVENKITAPFQPEQPERYKERAKRWLSRLPEGSDVRTVLLAPEVYMEHVVSRSFCCLVTYEDVIATLDRSDDDRLVFLSKTLYHGIEARRGRTETEPSESTTALWQGIHEMAGTHAPLLCMERPVSKGPGAGFIHLAQAEGMSRSITGGKAKLKYKFQTGNVDIEFSGMDASLLRSALADRLEDGMTVAQAGGSASVRIQVPQVSFHRPASQQEDAIRQSLEVAERLRLFFVSKELGKLLL